MIAVIGEIGAAGSTLALAVGRAAVADGAKVEIVGLVAADESGDRRVVEIGAAGLGHAAVLRSPATSLDPADLALALRYLPEIRVVVLATAGQGLLQPAIESAAFAGARLIVLTVAADAPVGLPDGAIAIQLPPVDDGTIAGFVGRLAATIDRGLDPGAAWTATVAALAVDSINPRADG